MEKNKPFYCNACAMHYKRWKKHKLHLDLDLDIIYCASILVDLKKGINLKK